MSAPSALEQEFLELVNRARMNPSGEFDALILDAATGTGVTAGVTNAISYFNVDLGVLKQQFDALTAAAAPLAWNGNLSDSATAHSDLMIQYDLQSHNLPGEASLWDRIVSAGYSNARIVGENVYAYTRSPVDGHAAFFIDWGTGPDGIQSPPGHRDNIMSTAYTEIGIAVVAENDSATSVGPYVVTQHFGNRSNYSQQLVGVVIDDDDGDAFYDAGEGLGGVKVTVRASDGTTKATTTWASGGYQMALAPGTYTVTFSDGPLSSSVTRTVTIGAANAKLDLVAPAGSLGGDTVLGATMGADDIIGTAAGSVIRLLAGDDRYDGRGGADMVYGGAGNDTLLGGDGADTLFGGDGNDTIDGGNGPDTVNMNAGNDLYRDNAQGGALGQDTVDAGLGNDTIQGGAGNDEFRGSDGNDLIFGRLGDDRLFGGLQFDTLDGGAGNDTIDGGLGRDKAFMGAGNDLYLDNGQGGLLGRDTVIGGGGNDTIQGGNGNDEFRGADGNDLIFGRLGDDKLFGGAQFDTLIGGDGNDTVEGGLGRDKVFMGTGNDLYVDNGQGGDLGRDTVFSGAGDDTVQGGNGADVFRGEPGNDLIYGRLGDDWLHGGEGNDTIDGGAGRDIVYLSAGDDLFLDNAEGGNAGRDTVYGADGSDTIQGGNGNDKFYGEGGADLIFGRLGDDTIDGGAGPDTLSGGLGADHFVFGAGFGTDLVTDFAAGTDTLIFDIGLWAGTLSAAQVAERFASVVGGDVVFTFTDGSTLTLDGVTDPLGVDIGLFTA
ncbi:MAG: CAP domain-containing protein [Paracoccaceae bacterium]